MAKKNPVSETAKRIQRTEAYAEKVRKMFAQTVNDILALNKSIPKLEEGVMFSFDDTSEKMQKEVEDALKRLHSSALLAIEQGITLEWEQANAECDELVSSIYGEKALSDPKLSAVMQRNTSAMKAFIERTENGLNLSDRVWLPVRQLRDEMEVAMTVAIGSGKSAASISRTVRECLNDPDLMFRRFRYKDENGKWRKKWKKRIKDEETGKYKWIDYDRDSYKTGTGVYKSSAKNAMRVARTETNIAYRRADNARWQQMDFVLGQKIQLSKNHPVRDICDTLQGVYPVDFVFDGWHPQCFCYVTPVLVDEDEMVKMNEAFINGEDYTPSGDTVKDYPDNFKDWVKDNADKISAAKQNGKMPYFVQNNQLAIDNILNPKKQLTAKEKAQIRHDSRTPEQIEAIKNRWAERKHQNELTKKTADNVLKVAKDYGEVDYSTLQKYITEGDLLKMKVEAKNVALKVSEIKKQENALSALIPDAHEWHKQFSMSELEAVYDAVDKKLSSMSGMTLQEKLKSFTKEAAYVADPTYLKPHKLYPTWQVAESAYTKQVGIVKEAIEWEDINAVLSEAKSFKTKSKPYLDLVDKLETAVSEQKKETAYSIINDMKLKREALQKAANARAKKKYVSVEDFGDECFSDSRKNKAVWKLTASEADDHFHENAVEFFAKLTEDEKEALWGYTGGSAYITEPLRAIKGHYYYNPSKRSFSKIKKDIDEMTSAMRKQTLNEDTWVKRDSDPWNIDYIFGIELDTYRTNPSALVGKIGIEDSFQSCGSCKETRFTCTGPKKVIMNLYCPKGTQACYAQPWSTCGTYKRSWDGKMKSNPSKYDENEVILQRGAKMRITKAEYKGGMWYIDVDVMGFNIREYDLIDDMAGVFCKFK